MNHLTYTLPSPLYVAWVLSEAMRRLYQSELPTFDGPTSTQLGIAAVFLGLLLMFERRAQRRIEWLESKNDQLQNDLNERKDVSAQNRLEFERRLGDVRLEAEQRIDEVKNESAARAEAQFGLVIGLSTDMNRLLADVVQHNHHVIGRNQSTIEAHTATLQTMSVTLTSLASKIDELPSKLADAVAARLVPPGESAPPAPPTPPTHTERK